MLLNTIFDNYIVFSNEDASVSVIRHGNSNPYILVLDGRSDHEQVLTYFTGRAVVKESRPQPKSNARSSPLRGRVLPGLRWFCRGLRSMGVVCVETLSEKAPPRQPKRLPPLLRQEGRYVRPTRVSYKKQDVLNYLPPPVRRSGCHPS